LASFSAVIHAMIVLKMMVMMFDSGQYHLLTGYFSTSFNIRLTFFYTLVQLNPSRINLLNLKL